MTTRRRAQRDSEAARVLALAGDLRVLLGQLKRRLREQARPGDLTTSELSVLGRLEREGPATVTALARAEGMRPQSMGATLSTLQAAGLVRGTPDPTDGRQTVLSVTAAARKLIEARRMASEDWLCRAIRSKLGTGEQQKLAAGVALLKRLVEP